jgi:D-serine ammonia-lyase
MTRRQTELFPFLKKKMASYSSSKLIASQVQTPALVVNIDKLKSNCDAMLDRAARCHCRLRPHAKTAKSVAITLFQSLGSKLAERAVDLKDGSVCAHSLDTLLAELGKESILATVATLGEAQSLFESMLPFDLCYAVPLCASKHQIERMLAIVDRLSRGQRLGVVVDSIDAATRLVDGLASSSRENGVLVPVWLMIDSGYGRCGLAPEHGDVERIVATLVGAACTQFAGLYTHGGSAYHADSEQARRVVADAERDAVGKLAKRLRAMPELADAPPFAVSIGSTPSCAAISDAPDDAVVDELHPGNYAFYDVTQATLGCCSRDQIACAVMATVIAHYPQRNTLLLDAGALALSLDTGATHVERSWGVIVGCGQRLRIASLSQEVAVVESSTGSAPIDYDSVPVGSRLFILPNHSCLTAACFAEYCIVDSFAQGANVLGQWLTFERRW